MFVLTAVAAVHGSGAEGRVQLTARSVSIADHWRRNVTKWWDQLNFEPIFRADDGSEGI